MLLLGDGRLGTMMQAMGTCDPHFQNTKYDVNLLMFETLFIDQWEYQIKGFLEKNPETSIIIIAATVNDIIKKVNNLSNNIPYTQAVLDENFEPGNHLQKFKGIQKRILLKFPGKVFALVGPSIVSVNDYNKSQWELLFPSIPFTMQYTNIKMKLQASINTQVECWRQLAINDREIILLDFTLNFVGPRKQTSADQYFTNGRIYKTFFLENGWNLSHSGARSLWKCIFHKLSLVERGLQLKEWRDVIELY
ncbi:unnamed protein product [Meganyctiphanes norvegica]|uniref:Uncharacterized protein n=1 Tax=Meganyctiphanes norvegica TaxID=48144 RepID=A0AAV2QC79_MEGNR